MLIVVNGNCKWCKKLSSGPLHDNKVLQLIKSDFVPVVVDQDRDKGLFPADYQTHRVPSIFYIDPYSHELWTSIGYRTTQELIYDIKEAARNQIEDLTGVDL